MSKIVNKFTYVTPENIKKGMEDHHFNMIMGKLRNGELKRYPKPNPSATCACLHIEPIDCRYHPQTKALLRTIEVYYEVVNKNEYNSEDQLTVSQEELTSMDRGKGNGEEVASGSKGGERVATF